MKWLLKNYMKKDTPFYILGVIGDVLAALMSRIWPIAATGKIIDIGIIQGNHEEMIRLFILSILIFVLGRIIAYFSIILSEKKTLNLNSRLGMAIHNKLFYLDHNYFENTTVGEMNTLLTRDIRNEYRMLTYDIKQFLQEFLVGLIALIYCITINWIMALALLAFLPIFLFITFNYGKKTDKLYKIEREKSSKLDSYIQENIEGNRLIRNLGTEDKEISKFKNLNEDYLNYQMKIMYKLYNHIGIVKFFSYLMWFVMVLLGGIFIIRGNLTLGEFMIFNGYIDMISKPMYRLIEYMSDIKYFNISLEKIKKVLNLEPKQKDIGTKKLENIENIKFKNINFETDDKKVLTDINLDMEKNKTYAFIGEVGSGKSSIGRLILRIIDSTSGELTINGEDINNYTIESVRDKIAYVAQTPFLFSDTIKNNVNFGNLSLKDDEIRHYLKLAKADYVERLEDGIDTVIGENGISLSGGEKQRLSLARALAKKPKLLILDDITSALDYESELEVTNNINNLNYDCTKIIVAQKIISVKNADKIFVVKAGEIINEGTHEELLKNSEMYKEIYDIQSGAVSGL